MATKRNTFVGGTHGTTITTGAGGNSGGVSGDFIETIVTTGTAPITQFNNTQHIDGMAARVSSGTTNGVSFLEWNSGISGSTAWLRAYVYRPTQTLANAIAMRWAPSSGACAGIRWNSTGTLSLTNENNAVVATSSNNMPADSWYRVEARCLSHATAGELEAWVYFNPDSDTPDENFSASAVDTNGGTITTARFGPLNPNTTNQDFRFARIAFSDTGKIGPDIRARKYRHNSCNFMKPPKSTVFAR